jgi:hypothetical protein
VCRGSSPVCRYAQGKKGPELLPKFTLDRYKAIVEFKTAYYSFYLPLACGLILGGYSDDASLAITKEVSVALGEKFQIEVFIVAWSLDGLSYLGGSM